MVSRNAKVMFTWHNGSQLHTLWKNFITQPPADITYVDAENEEITLKQKTSHQNKLLLALWNIKRRSALLTYHYKVHEEKTYSKQRETHTPDIVYCMNGRMHRGETPWVVDFENPTAFFCFNKKAMQRYKESIASDLKKATALLPYSDTGRKAFLSFFGDEFKDSVITVQNTVPIPKKVTRIAHKGFTLLFTGSTNINDNFSFRGGRELVRAFVRLAKKFPDLRLVMRSAVPAVERRMLEGTNHAIIEDVLPAEKFEGLFSTADVYVLPAFIGYALSSLEAMSRGLPVITSDLLENAEAIDNGVEGLKVEPPKIEYAFPYIPTYYLDEKVPKIDEEYVRRIADAISTLYKNREKTKKMGRAARNRVKKKHSIQEKNRILKNIFEKSMKGKNTAM